MLWFDPFFVFWKTCDHLAWGVQRVPASLTFSTTASERLSVPRLRRLTSDLRGFQKSHYFEISLNVTWRDLDKLKGAMCTNQGLAQYFNAQPDTHSQYK